LGWPNEHRGPWTYPRYPRRLHECRCGCHQHQHLSRFTPSAARRRHRVDGRIAQPYRSCLAVEARSQAGAAARVAIAGTISTASAHELASPDEGYDAYREQATLLTDAGADLILLEMLKDIPQTQSALVAASESGLPVWAGFSCRVDPEGIVRVLEGGREGGAPPTFDEALTAIGELHVDATLIMHTIIEDVAPALAVLTQHWAGPTGAYPHVGKWLRPGWEFGGAMRPARLSNDASEWRAGGAQIFGSCCGLGPDYIAALNTKLR
jgi:homocysteine S-methyltransferase